MKNLKIIYTEEELNSEVWKDVLDYDYQCQISSLGRFKRVTSFFKKYVNQITLGSKDSRDYLRVQVSKNCVPKSVKVHRLVAKYFLENYSEELTINHKNFNKGDNRLSNLEVISASENIIDYITKVRKKKSYSEVLGVGYHSQISKWTTRVNKNNKRISLGTYETKEEAEQIIIDYNNGIQKEEKLGKGISNIGIRKYTNDQVAEIKSQLLQIGFRKTMKLYNVGSSTLKLIKNNEYNERRD